MVAANSAQTSPEALVNNKRVNRLNACQIIARITKSLPRREPASTVDHTRRLTKIRENVKFQLVVTEAASFFKMLLSRSAQPTAEQPKTASNAHQTDAH
jgi:hypothetical protein